MTMLSGQVRKSQARRFISLVLTFRQIREAFAVYRFNYQMDEGEQRDLIPSHVRALRKAIQDDQFTPTSLTAGLRAAHEEQIEYYEEGGAEHARIVVSPDDKLPLTDGQQRLAACEGILAEGDERVLDLEFPVIVILDTKTREDFINLQKGKAVDATHKLTLQTRAKLLPGKKQEVTETALNAATALNTDKDSPYHNQVRFDSRGLSPLKAKTLCAESASDLSTSLVGLARVTMHFDDKQRDGDWAGGRVLEAYDVLQEKAPALLEEGKFLTPPPEGTKGSATMLIGVGVMLAYRLLALGKEAAGAEDRSRLADCARATLDGDFSGPTKRAMMHQFAREFLADLDEEFHEGIPLRLVEALSPSSMAVSKPPKKKAPSRRKRQTAPPVVAQAGAVPN